MKKLLLLQLLMDWQVWWGYLKARASSWVY